MKLNILFFSTLRGVAGCDEMSLTLTDSSVIRVAEVLDLLYAKTPGLKEWDSQVLLALDQAYVDRDAEVNDGQELAIMPPVQGG
ncbi:MAG: MoaD/ThiS family protein [Verrucomicrobiales bacterium]|jgi:molybdopterin converting factor small subunit|nr:MoaD/ThiS family protein [Verrucomicrobiales bacterium]MDC0313041.1 MoaD/ThiS family protein [Verrucomicrobiales bacterium]MDF1790146.1 MoaD/ThiS family protein [Verrucomicrobiales bacterium]